MAGDETSAAVLKALDAARGLQHAGAGLIVVLFRDAEVAATLHWRADGWVAATMVGLARSLGADGAVLIVVGSPRVVGAVIVACDVAAEELIGAGLMVAARIHVRALTDSGMLWTDLSGAAARDGSLPPRDGVSAVPGRGRNSGVLGFLRRR
ncbi:hypothetical protein [Nocardia sp. CY41]|uniref:hypothetical protein n=1 Tax=Nocardia sp. CY41 TaxID=2608686 RepID=UPI00135C66A5|nr:hypothetical protein [Nocardia sp. CY41]